MGTVLRISAFVLAGLVLLAAIVWIGLFHTPAGKSFLRDQVLIYADQFAAERYNSDIAISDLSGDLPGRITLSDVLLRDEEGVWLRVDYLELDWSPWSLIARKIIVQDLIIRNAELSRLPPLPEREEPPAESRSVAEYLNMDLPWIEIANVTVESFSTDEGILGEARTFFVNGSLSTANGIVRSDIGLNTAAETDDITSVIALDGETLTVDISVTSSEAGLVTWALNEEEPLSFSLRGEGPVGSLEGVMQFNSLSYGTADIDLLADLTRQNRFQVDGSYSPGAALPQPVQQAAGDGFEFSVLAEKSDGGYNLTTEKFSGYFGLLSGTVGDLPLSMPIEGADFDLILRLSQDYAADRQISLLAGENRLAGSLSYVDDSLQMQGQLDTPVGSVNIAQLQQGPESGLDATLSASVERSPVDQALARDILRDGGLVFANPDRADAGGDTAWFTLEKNRFFKAFDQTRANLPECYLVLDIAQDQGEFIPPPRGRSCRRRGFPQP